ncbi:MAG: hypothetical protein FWG79_01830 [Bacteroidales bacterium]|nr:hypothetical protein [Bacteroidales bacterium]
MKITIKTYKNGGSVEMYTTVDRQSVDYKKILAICKEFAKQGKDVVILPKVHIKDPLYKEIYKDLIGTVYERKCPDFMVNGRFYEYESFTTNNPKKAFLNMISRGRQQSNRLVIEESGYSHFEAKRYLKNTTVGQPPDGKYPITEVWIFDRNRTLIRLF